MTVWGALLLFSVFIIMYIIIIEVFTVLFRLTGLTEEKAKLQVISMLTNSGFTTVESEVVLTSKRRRNLTRVTILFGYSFTVTIVSIIVNVFLALNQSEMDNLLISAIIMFGLFIFLYMLTRLKWIKKSFDGLIEKLGNRLMFGKGSNPLVLMDTYGDNAMAEIKLTNLPKILDGVSLSKSPLKEKYRIQILLIKRENEPMDTPDGSTVILKDDIVIVFGPYKSIREVFENPEESEKLK